MEGILLVDKPSGWTSFDAVNYVRKMIRQAEAPSAGVSRLSGVQGADEQRTEPYMKYGEGAAQPATPQSAKSDAGTAGLASRQGGAVRKPRVKVGHTGTLDPLATGLLVLLIGKNYTRRASEFSKLDKTYEVEMTLGQTSSTGDNEGEKTLVSSAKPTLGEIKLALAKFVGEISQTPPVYSAIKVGGRRAYELARKGQSLALEPRLVTIHEITLAGYDYPRAKFSASVSSGTYIRSLVEDIGTELKTGAFTSALKRTSVGKFKLKGAASLDDKNLLAKIQPLAS